MLELLLIIFAAFLAAFLAAVVVHRFAMNDNRAKSTASPEGTRSVGVR